ncbi:hypothetical protein HG536_0A05880 [Torulaspora globosa]|uniref:Homeobox domain-containing protein n=1 Tax=Torulaspora globosa TaxID=48254 RepID=A0A7G3ZB87_9SACH|nr:uncharacterized protein HG536_0A05880 [Torulaspora globosa]QLL30773.1 hypothetical protein HG536_0A05880 [Torulaspora globosa]
MVLLERGQDGGCFPICIIQQLESLQNVVVKLQKRDFDHLNAQLGYHMIGLWNGGLFTYINRHGSRYWGLLVVMIVQSCLQIRRSTSIMSSEKRLLPSLAVLLNDSRPAIANLRPSFCSGEEGYIRLPPLGDSGISGTRAVESAVRYTVSLPMSSAGSSTPARATTVSSHTVSQTEPLSVATPSTPVVKRKSLVSSSRKNEMLTPLSAARAVITPSNSEKKRAFAFITHSQETFPTKEPKIDNAPLARRKRRRTSTQELNILQAEFNQCPAPDKRKRQELAERCNMSEKAIQIWFQNKRQATKRQKNSAQKALVAAQLDSTPLASKQLTQIDKHTKSKQPVEETTPEISSGDTTPTKAVPSVSRKEQALTFHLTSDNEVLTPVRTSSNSRIKNLRDSDDRPRSAANSPKTKPTESPTERIPLNELKINALVH